MTRMLKATFAWSLLLGAVFPLVQGAPGDGLDSQVTLGQLPQGAALAGSKRPNIVFILTDDQDLHMNSLDYIPLINKHLIDQGTLFKKHFCTTAICCPARVTLWTGKAAHNTNVTDVSPPYGMCYTATSSPSASQTDIDLQSQVVTPSS